MARFNDYVDDVHDWNVDAGHLPLPPEHLDRWENDENYRELALVLIEEEVAELREAVEEQDPVETLDALCDILFTVFGLAAKSGHDTILEAGLKEVIYSNFTKVRGEKVYLDNGKVGKPVGYKPPELEPIVNEAHKRGLL